MRILLTKRGCPFCRDIIKVVNKINWRLDIDKRIKIVDCWEWEEFKLDYPLIMRKFEKEGQLQGYPHLYMDGVEIDPAPTSELMRALLESYLKEDFKY